MRQLILAIALVLAASPLVAADPVQGGPIPVPLPLFPQNNWWNTDISNAPIDPASLNFITFIGATKGLRPDFGGDADFGDVYGFPFIVVDADQVKKAVTFDYFEQSDGINHPTNVPFPFYPIPDQVITQRAWMEGGQPGNVNQRATGDRHILIVDKTNNHLYELYNMWWNGTGWEGGSGAFFNMNTNNRRPDGWTSADAAGLAILPGLVRYDEVNGPDEIRHAFRVTVRATNNYYVFPASHVAGANTSALPLGARLRLKASKDISGFPADVQKIYRALKKYGLIVADNGSDLYISGSYDTRWNNDVLNPAFAEIRASDLEVIQLGWAPPQSFILTLPKVAGIGDAATATLTVYNPNYTVATGYTGTVQFTSTGGSASLPANYTFTGADAGVHTFPAGFTFNTTGTHIVTITDVGVPTITGSVSVIVGPATPTGVTATASSAAQINISWLASAGATQYQVLRATTGAFSPFAPVSALNFTDSTPAAGTSYLYKVRAIDASLRESPLSLPDVATTILFTDDPAQATVTSIKAIHVTELRQAVNVVRFAANLGAFPFTDPGLAPGDGMKALHIQQLRTSLSEARSQLGLSAIPITDPTLLTGSTVVKAAHVQELRSGVK